MSQHGSPWTFEDYDYLYKNYSTEGPVVCSEKLERSVEVVNTKAMQLNLELQGGFKQEEIALARSYGKTLGNAMIFLLPKRTTHEIEELIECVSKH